MKKLFVLIYKALLLLYTRFVTNPMHSEQIIFILPLFEIVINCYLITRILAFLLNKIVKTSRHKQFYFGFFVKLLGSVARSPFC